MRTGTTLLRQSSDGLEPLGAFNQPVYKSYGQIRAALLSDLGARYADYFPRPDFNSNGKQIGWVAQTPGAAKRWMDMAAEEQAALEPVKREIQGGFSDYVAKLQAAPENSPRNNFGKVLSQALRTPDGDHLYFIDKQPMISFWGFKRAGQAGGIDPLGLPVRTVEVAAPALGEAAEAGAVVRTALLAEKIRPWWLRLASWWKWLMWLLLLLLLLALLWWLLGPRLGLPWPQALLWHSSPFEMATQRHVVPPGNETVVVHPDTGGSALITRPAIVPSVGSSGSGIAPGTSGNEATPGITTRKSGNGAVPQGQEPGQRTSNGPSTQLANGPSSSTPGENPRAPQTANLPPLPPSGTQLRNLGPLTLPQGQFPAGPATFMQGLWRSESGLLDSQNRSVEEFYRFNDKGQGAVTVRGASGTECTGSANATVDAAHQLQIVESPTLKCSDGSTMSGAKTVCANGTSNVAGCQGTNSSNKSSFDVKMEKLEEGRK